MELVKGGQLKTLIDSRFARGEAFTDDETSIIMKSIISAVKYFHFKDIVHRDLKPGMCIIHPFSPPSNVLFIENILINNYDDLSSIKVADFGLSAQFDDEQCFRSLRQKCGTMVYMAPELAAQDRYGKVNK